MAVPLTLAPHESRFIVIGVLPAGAREPVPTVSTSQTVAGLGGPWSVTLGEKQLSSPLKSWEEMDAGTFAGTAVYKQEFTVAAALPQDKRVYLDLGDVHETARVQLNGTQLDARPWPPYLWDVTHSIKSGANTLEVEVQKAPAVERRGAFGASGARSRRSGGGASTTEAGASQGSASTGVPGGPPGGSIPGEPTAPIAASGLLGPVRVLAQ